MSALRTGPRHPRPGPNPRHRPRRGRRAEADGRTPVAASTFPLLDLAAESLAGLLQRPMRSFLTVLGTVLGIGSFVAVLGLTSTAGGQISKDFTVLAATEVDVQDLGSGQPGDTAMSFPADADQRVQALHGVVHAGVWWQVPLRSPQLSDTPDAPSDADGNGPTGVTVYAADPEALAAMHATASSGVLLNAFDESHHAQVAVLGSGAADQLGITDLSAQPAVFVNGRPFTVVGVIGGLKRDPQLLNAVVLPDSTALSAYGPPTDPTAQMVVETTLGAPEQVAHEAPLALRPDAPTRFRASAPIDPKNLQNDVAGAVNSLFLVLAAISLVIGAVGIANTTLVAVLERTGEIGLRRALGARRAHISLQFLTESAVLGLLGGLIGTALGVAAVVGTAVAHHWTAVLQPWAVVPAPAAGAVVGLVAGVYPALRAAWIEPVEALRR